MKKFYMSVIIVFILSFMGVYAQGETTKCCNEQCFVKGCILNAIIEGNEKICLDGLLNEDNAKSVIEEVIAENSKAAKVSRFEIKNENGSIFAAMEYEECLSLFEVDEVSAEKERIFSVIRNDMSDLEKALAVHDYMVQNYEFDLTYSLYSAEDIFAHKKGVCQAYALAYIEIMTELGIECKYVPSDPMNHAWNLIKIDGEWYHVDATWDDPVPDLLGNVKHTFFLISDSLIADADHGEEHYGWTSFEKATSTKYDSYFWHNVSKPIIDKDKHWFYIDDGGNITKKNTDTGAEKIIYTISDRWGVKDKPGWYWNDRFSGIGIYGERIYFNTPSKIKSIDLNGKKEKTEYDIGTSDMDLYGFVLNGGKILYGLSTTPYNGIEETGNIYIKYTVTFDGMGGVLSKNYIELDYGKKFGKLPVPVREGYAFKGWYTEKDGGTLITETSDFKQKSDITLYARWEKLPAEIEAKPEKKDGKCIVKVNPKWIEEKEEAVYIFVACYKEGKLSHIERRRYDGHEEAFIADDDSDVKIMVWGGDELSNICGKIMINKSEFGN